VVQDTRGRYRSQGVFSKYYACDTTDGFDAVEWAARLPGSNGRVGMWGTSYAAHTQAGAAKLAPPHLRALLLNMGGMASGWDHSVGQGGAFELGRQLTWAWEEIVLGCPDPVARAQLAREQVADWYSALPLRKGLSPLAAVPEFEAYYLAEATPADFGPFWRGPGLDWEDRYAGTADVPMLHVGGWYDTYLRGTIGNFTGLAALKRSPMRLLIGPWTHHGNASSHAGEVEFGPAAAIPDFDSGFHLAWFDRRLKDRPGGDDPVVRYFLMGTGDGHRDQAGRLFHGGEWRQAGRWPPPGVRPTRFYLQPGGGLAPRPPAGGAPSVTYTFDPAHPVPTLGGGVSHRLRDGAYDQRERPGLPGCRPPYLPLRARADVLVFQTEPLGANRRQVAVDNTVHHSPRRPSHILLPILAPGFGHTR